MGAGWAVNEDAIEAMRATADGLTETTEEIMRAIDDLESAFDENEGGLGAHSDSIRELIDELRQVGNEASNPVKILVLKLSKSILIRQKHIDENHYQTGKSR